MFPFCQQWVLLSPRTCHHYTDWQAECEKTHVTQELVSDEMTSECWTYRSPISSQLHKRVWAHTYWNRTAVCCWNLPIILYFTGPSLHLRCDWNNNHPPIQAILHSLWGRIEPVGKEGRERDGMVGCVRKGALKGGRGWVELGVSMASTWQGQALKTY